MSEITIRQARLQGTGRLQNAGIDTAALDARVLIAYVLDISQTSLLVRDPDPVPEVALGHYQDLIEKRSTGVPVAHLIGQREFMGLTFRTTHDVLVPRPDTEPLVEWGLEWLSEHPAANVVDIGTGSGAIAIAMTFHAPASWHGSTIATDVSEAALEIARANADAILSPARRERLRFNAGYLAAALTQPVDFLLTNLPYLTPAQIAENPDLRHEPNLALDGGADGLDLIREVVADLPRILAPEGAVGFEIDPSQSGEVQRILATTLPNHQVSVIHDLAGDERHIVARKP